MAGRWPQALVVALVQADREASSRTYGCRFMRPPDLAGQAGTCDVAPPPEKLGGGPVQVT